MKKDDKKNYYQDIIEKINALYKDGQFEQAINILVEELKMPYIPLKYEKEFSRLFKEITLASEDKIINEKYKKVLTNNEIIKIFESKEPTELEIELAINSLEKINIRQVLKKLQKILIDPTKNDFIKTLIFLNLVKQKIDEEIIFVKQDETHTLKPSDCEILEESKVLAAISRLLEEHLYQNQTQLDIAFGIMQSYLIIIFPKLIDLSDYDYIACACHYMSETYLNSYDSFEIDDILKRYNVTDQKKFLKILEDMQKNLDKKY